MRADQPELRQHGVVHRPECNRFIALVREGAARGLEIAHDGFRSVEYLTGAEQLVARMGERLERSVEVAPVLRFHVRADDGDALFGQAHVDGLPSSISPISEIFCQILRASPVVKFSISVTASITTGSRTRSA